MSKRGRPTKYEGKTTVEKVYLLIDAMQVETFFQCCGIEQIAKALGVHKDTIYEWCKEYPDFSDAIKLFQTERDALFLTLAASPQVKVATWIFLAKNWLGMSDKQEIEHAGEFLPLQVIVKTDGTEKN